MSRDAAGRRPVLRAGVALVAVLATGTACVPLDNAMAAIFGRSMRDSRSFDPYENTRLPAEGSVAFAQGNYPAILRQENVQVLQGEIQPLPDFTAADMGRGGEVASALENPIPADSASLARGQEMYNRYCAVCHGPAGVSADAPIAPKLPLVQAFNLASGNAVGFSDGYLYGMIRVGRGAMPAYGHRITHLDRWHIVNYVRELQQRAGATPAAGAADAPADSAAVAEGEN